jgi:hypothetical protein
VPRGETTPTPSLSCPGMEQTPLGQAPPVCSRLGQILTDTDDTVQYAIYLTLTARISLNISNISPFLSLVSSHRSGHPTELIPLQDALAGRPPRLPGRRERRLADLPALTISKTRPRRQKTQIRACSRGIRIPATVRPSSSLAWDSRETSRTADLVLRTLDAAVCPWLYSNR